MANGVTRGPGGLIFASSDFGTGIDLIQKRQVQIAWATLVSPNGLITDSTGKYLFANQTFTAAAIQRIPIDDPAGIETYYSAGPADVAAGFDGLTRDGEDRLYVAANNAGQVWRVDGPGDACSLLDAGPLPERPQRPGLRPRRHGGQVEPPGDDVRRRAAGADEASAELVAHGESSSRSSHSVSAFCDEGRAAEPAGTLKTWLPSDRSSSAASRSAAAHRSSCRR